MTSKPKLLYAINHIDWFWSHRLPLATAAQAAGWDVHIAVPGAAADENLAKHNFTGHEMPAGIIKTIIALRALIRAKRPDLIHAITLKYAFIAGLATLFIPNVKIVHTIAGLGYLFSSEGLKPKIIRTLLGPFLRIALRRKNMQLIFQNPDDMQILLKRGLAVLERSHLIRGSGVDTTEFTPQDTPAANPPIIVMPTRLVHDKGVAVFIGAARILRDKGIKAEFQIAGGVSANNPLSITQAEMDEMTKDGAVNWLGRVNDMPALLARASFIAYPSYYREGIPKVLLESAAMGKAIITTDHPGCREAVTDGENGLLVPVKDPESLAAAIETLLSDPEQTAKMGQKSRIRAEKEFDVNLINTQTIAIYAL